MAPHLRRLRLLGSQLEPPAAAADAAATSEGALLYSPPHPDRLPYTESTTDAICAALRTDGCALLRSVISPECALHLGGLLRGYIPLPHEDGRDTGTDVGPNRRSGHLRAPPRIRAAPIPTTVDGAMIAMSAAPQVRAALPAPGPLRTRGAPKVSGHKHVQWRR